VRRQRRDGFAHSSQRICSTWSALTFGLVNRHEIRSDRLTVCHTPVGQTAGTIIGRCRVEIRDSAADRRPVHRFHSA
jgi:hypothetical protein